MKKKHLTEAQIVFALRQAEHGTLVAKITQKMEISEVTFYRWKKKCTSSSGFGPCADFLSTDSCSDDKLADVCGSEAPVVPCLRADTLMAAKENEE
jgi:hypothetical protein